MRKLITCLWSLCLVSLCMAQGNQKTNANQTSRPDLTGKWTLDKKKSKFGGARPTGDVVTLSITQREPEIRILRRTVADGREQTKELVYYSDGRGETNQAIFSDEMLTSKTVWNGQKLLVKWMHRQRIRGNDFMYMEYTEKLELSADGQTLTWTTSMGRPRSNSDRLIFVPGDMSDIKRVFRREP